MLGQQKYFGSYFGVNENFEICFQDLLTSQYVCTHLKNILDLKERTYVQQSIGKFLPNTLSINHKTAM